MSVANSIIVIVVTTLLAGFFAGSETALVSCSKIKIRSLAKKGSWRARLLERLLSSPEEFFSIVLVGTNLAVVICTATATALAVSRYGAAGPLISTVVMTPLILIFGEVIPKSAYLYYANRLAILVSPLLRLMHFILYPLVLPTTLIARLLTGFSRDEEKKLNIISTREELIYLYNRGRGEDIEEMRAASIIDKVFSFGDVRAADLMIPIERVITFPVTASVDDLIEEVIRHPYSRYPLTSPESDRIVGIISVIDLLGLDGGERLATVMHPPFTASEDELAERLLLLMKDDPNHFAVILGSDGSPSGIITLEDVLENIVGDIATGH